MTDLDVEGLFWRPDRPDRKMAGHLQFGPTDGAILSIVEPFLNPDSLGVRFDDDGVRLLGIAGSHVLTLDQCHLIGGSQESNGMGQRRYRVFTVLSGAHFGIDEPLSFSSVTMQLSNLVPWVGRSGLSVDYRPKGDSGKAADFRINFTSVPSIETATNGGSIAVTFPWRWETDRFSKSMVEQKCALEYRFHTPQPLVKIMGICTSLRNLLTICVQSPSTVIDARLTHPDLDRPMTLFVQWIGKDSRREQDSIDRSKMSLTFDDIGGVEGIRAWLDLASRYSELIAMLVSHWYTPTLYQEQRYFNAVVAVEMLIRIRKNRNDVNLRQALGDLVQEVKSLFEPLVGDLKRWTQEVVQSRDNYVVHPGLRGNSDGYRLYLLSESIYILVVLTLLQECGVSIDSLKNIQNHQHFKWLAAELGAPV